MNPPIYLSPPDIRAAERERLLAAVDSGWAAPAGPELDAFEHELAELANVPYAVALSSGTAGLHLALLVLGVSPGDEVLVSTYTFVATANAVRYLNAVPVFLDSEDRTWNMSPELLAEELEERKRRGRLPRAAVIVDLYGQCADYDSLLPLCRENGVLVVEDAAESIGAWYRGSPAGSFGDASVFSFNGNKLITASGGGALLTRNRGLAERVRHLATQARMEAPHYQHEEVGFNYRLSNLLAAFGRGQLQTIDQRIARRQEIRARYAESVGKLQGVELLPTAPGSVPNAWLTVITIDAEEVGFSASELRVHLEASNIEARLTWKPMHLQPLYSDFPARVDGTSERLFAESLCLPSGSGMDHTQQDRVIEAIMKFVET